ncbi:MAG: hypothetical protein LH615_04140 [Ferruginibacter sp.]|nr:hypothetical protein [Ferruginibacter sp.]
MSKLFTLNVQDLSKGLIIAVLTSVLTVIFQSLQLGELNFNWKLILLTALTSSVAYLLKNLATNNEGEILSKDSLIGGRINDR